MSFRNLSEDLTSSSQTDFSIRGQSGTLGMTGEVPAVLQTQGEGLSVAEGGTLTAAGWAGWTDGQLTFPLTEDLPSAQSSRKLSFLT